MTTIWLAVLASAFGACLYAYIGYPALLWLLARTRGRPVHRAPIAPSVTVIVPAHNEEATIERKVLNTLGLDYPPAALELLVVSDGSTDGTEAVVRRFEDPRVRVVAIPRAGKVRALEEGARRATGEVLVFTDADSMLDPEAVARLVEPFADAEVGGVCGRKVRENDGDRGPLGLGERLYWRYVQSQKEWESAIGSAFGAHGGLYAMRRKLFVPLEDPGQVDDLAISARVVLAGHRLVFEPRAVVREAAPADERLEFARKVRVVNQTLSALLLLGPRLWGSGFYSVQLVSQKLFRYGVPFFLLALLASTAALVPVHSFFRLLLAGQAGAYCLGGAGLALKGTRFGKLPILSLPGYFLLVNAAAAIGVVSVARGRRTVLWSPRGGFVPRAAGGRGPARSVLAAVSLPFLLALAPGVATAQSTSADSRVAGQLRLMGLRLDNFFQAPKGSELQGVDLAQARASLAVRPVGDIPLEVFGKAAYSAYSDGLDDAREVGGGLRLTAWPVGLQLEGTMELDRPSFEVGDAFARMDVRRGSGELTIRPVRWGRLIGMGSIATETFQNVEEKDSRFHTYGGAARFDIGRGVLSLQGGAEWGERDADEPNESLRQRDLLAQLRSAGVEGLWLGLRFRYRERDYLVPEPEASNYDRRDLRRQWSLSAQFPSRAPVALIGYFSFEDARSTRPSRNFESNVVGLGVSLAF